MRRLPHEHPAGRRAAALGCPEEGCHRPSTLSLVVPHCHPHLHAHCTCSGCTVAMLLAYVSGNSQHTRFWFCCNMCVHVCFEIRHLIHGCCIILRLLSAASTGSSRPSASFSGALLSLAMCIVSTTEPTAAHAKTQ